MPSGLYKWYEDGHIESLVKNNEIIDLWHDLKWSNNIRVFVFMVCQILMLLAFLGNFFIINDYLDGFFYDYENQYDMFPVSGEYITKFLIISLQS